MAKKTGKKELENLLDLIHSDLDAWEAGSTDLHICNIVEGVGLVLPFNWTAKWCPDLTVPFEHFIDHQTVSMSGPYSWDVRKFLQSKLRHFDDHHKV